MKQVTTNTPDSDFQVSPGDIMIASCDCVLSSTTTDLYTDVTLLVIQKKPETEEFICMMFKENGDSSYAHVEFECGTGHRFAKINAAGASPSWAYVLKHIVNE